MPGTSIELKKKKIASFGQPVSLIARGRASATLLSQGPGQGLCLFG